MVGSAVQCALLYALMSVNGPGSPLDKPRFACEAWNVRLAGNCVSANTYIPSFAGQSFRIFNLTQLLYGKKRKEKKNQKLGQESPSKS